MSESEKQPYGGRNERPDEDTLPGERPVVPPTGPRRSRRSKTRDAPEPCGGCAAQNG